MTSYAIYKWRCSSCSQQGSVWPLDDDETPPSTCPKCGSSDIEYPYEPPVEMEPIPELEGTPEEQIASLLEMFEKEPNGARMFAIAKVIDDIQKGLSKSKK